MIKATERVDKSELHMREREATATHKVLCELFERYGFECPNNGVRNHIADLVDAAADWPSVRKAFDDAVRATMALNVLRKLEKASERT